MKRPFTKPAWFLEIILSKIFFILLAIAVDPILYITDKSDMGRQFFSLYKNFIRTKDANDLKKYKLYKNKLTSILRHSEKMYYICY